jgi:predicted nuclease of restriction endonuclease-like (RecB) superfamily
MIISDDNKEYINFLAEVKQRIKSSQYEALKAVNKQLINLYWEIGALIVSRQDAEGWGKSIVNQLAKDLQTEFPGISGFSSRNIWRMREFYVTYIENEKLTPMVAEIGWTHNLVILEKCKDDLEREFYLRMTRKFGWTKNILIHQIENQS